MGENLGVHHILLVTVVAAGEDQKVVEEGEHSWDLAAAYAVEVHGGEAERNHMAALASLVDQKIQEVAQEGRQESGEAFLQMDQVEERRQEEGQRH